MAEAADTLASRWNLTAPETYLLLAEDKRPSTVPFKLALAELIARGIYGYERAPESRTLFATTINIYLLPGGNGSRPPEDALRAIFDLVEDLPARSTPSGRPGVPLVEVVRAVEKKFKTYSNSTGYSTRCVWPALCGRGLAEQRTDHLFLFISTSRNVLTPKGEAARDQARIVLDAAERTLHRLVLSDLPAAAAFAAMAGSALLLSSGLYLDLRAIAEHLSQQAEHGGAESSQSTAKAGAGYPGGLFLDAASLEAIAYISEDVDRVEKYLEPDSN